MFVPEVALPADDYVGRLTPVAASLICCEYVAFFGVALLCSLFVIWDDREGRQPGTEVREWSWALTPVLLFDGTAILLGLVIVLKNIRWMLSTELRLRLFYVAMFVTRMTTNTLILLHILLGLPLWLPALASVIAYIGHLAVHIIVVRRMWSLVRLNVMDLTVTLTLGFVALKSAHLLEGWSWDAAIWPLYALLAICAISGAIVVFFLNREDILRIGGIAVVVMCCLFAVALKGMTSYIGHVHHWPVLDWIIPLWLAFVILGVFVVLGATIVASPYLTSEEEDPTMRVVSRSLWDVPAVRQSGADETVGTADRLKAHVRVPLVAITKTFFRPPKPEDHFTPSLLHHTAVPSTTPFFRRHKGPQHPRATTGPSPDSDTDTAIDLTPLPPPAPDASHRPSPSSFVRELMTRLAPWGRGGGQSSVPSSARSVAVCEVERDVERPDDGSPSELVGPRSPLLESDVMVSEVDKVEGAAGAAQCFICCDKPANSTFLYCGHGGCCVSCAQLLFHRGATCPVCRAPSSAVVRLWPVDTIETAEPSPPAVIPPSEMSTISPPAAEDKSQGEGGFARWLVTRFFGSPRRNLSMPVCGGGDGAFKGVSVASPSVVEHVGETSPPGKPLSAPLLSNGAEEGERVLRPVVDERDTQAAEGQRGIRRKRVPKWSAGARFVGTVLP
ncbi:unnamed protein product [Vitrella brassicaformis CCMP3155]|uniref:RING-type domain-containing protein n=1 Tax=Vitrella brassicaformis (strain CCMP3155) TaxID=1169540 RepID=A0A0G4H6R2_VITBC|nr:unnamed protein product [Vitrella brassicaformis CCMP3155]|eukprot:CEM39528.1 unnamed protein product [Vitrella brassicaformis CCMP3155]